LKQDAIIEWLYYENLAYAKGFSCICGVDEVGRGPLIGSVVAAAVILPKGFALEGLNDSKKLSEKKREQLELKIKEAAIAWAVAEANHEEIDELNILHASLLAMKRAVEALEIPADYALIDGNRCPLLDIPSEAIVKGDGLSASIAAASVLAKVARDAQMRELALQYPQYGFEKHKGYPTQAHYDAIEEHGVLPMHRRSFRLFKKP
jgi:ribonuclease HII